MTCPHPEKHRHATRARAAAHLAAMDHAGRAGLRLRVYPCGAHWHIGNKSDGSVESQLKRALKAGRKNARRRRVKR